MGTSRAFAAVLVLTAAVVAAQEEPQASGATPQATVETEERDALPRPALRVLRHPYEISSFYRSGESPLGPWAGLPADPSYRIADFYRSRQGGAPLVPTATCPDPETAMYGRPWRKYPKSFSRGRWHTDVGRWRQA